jgi:hypothetical protein
MLARSQHRGSVPAFAGINHETALDWIILFIKLGGWNGNTILGDITLHVTAQENG